MQIKNTDQLLTTDCRFCSLVSKANGEDPIGTAGTYDHWFILEAIKYYRVSRLIRVE